MGIHEVSGESELAEVAEELAGDSVVGEAVQPAERPLQGGVEGGGEGHQLPQVTQEGEDHHVAQAGEGGPAGVEGAEEGDAAEELVHSVSPAVVMDNAGAE